MASLSETDSISDGSTGPASGSLNRRPRSCCPDKGYGRKVLLTAAVCWSYVVLGWVVCQIGAALPDLQHLARVDLNTASWLFTSWSIGYVIGSLVSGILFDKLNRLAIMLLSSVGMAICSACLPYSGSFTGMIVVRLVTGVFCGSSDTGANTIVPSTWNAKGRPFMQALYLSYTVGGITSPLATRPFMLHKMSHSSEASRDTETHYETSNMSDHGQNRSSHLRYDTDDVSQINVSLYNAQLNISNNSYAQEGSSIYYAFVVTGVLVLTSAIPYFVMFFNGNFDKKTEVTDPSKEDNELLEKNKEKEEAPEKSYIKYVVLACVAGINTMYGATEDSLGDFLVTFCLDYLEWSNSAAVSLSSLYWVASCLGGLGGILITSKFTPAPVLSTALAFWNASFLTIVIASIWKLDLLIWIFIPVSGFCMVFIIPTLISWTSENVCEISGKVSSLVVVATGVGLAANPSFIGYMMEKYDYIYFFYILFSESVLCTLLFALANIFNKCCSRPSFRETEGNCHV